MTKKASSLVRKIFPHVYLLSASGDALEKGEKSEEGSTYSFLASMLFTAFALEAYLNEVGREKIPGWKQIERKKNPKEKLLLLCKEKGYIPDLNERPFKTFIDTFAFRNLVVHAKPEKIERNEIEFTSSREPKLPESKWLERCTFHKAKQYLDDTEEIIKILHLELKVETVSNLFAENTTWWTTNVDLENDAG